MPKRKTTSEFIAEASRIHAGFYSYGDTVYTKRFEKVVITCPVHGNFKQTAGNHLGGSGCQKCQKEKASRRMLSNTKEFITKSKKRFGDKFDYSDTEYKDASSKLILICCDHGRIEVSPHFHLTSQFGCHRCGIENRGFVKRNETQSFIADAKRTHGERFDYTKTDYQTAKTKVTIVCNDHGKFGIIPYHHLKTKSGGCPGCKRDVFSEINLKDTAYFIEKSILIHGDKYDYSLSEYTKSVLPVKIICPEHGIFFQSPNAHMAGKGCKLCGHKIISENPAPFWIPEVYAAKFETTHLYLVKITSNFEDEQFYKIGISVNPDRRFYEISQDSKGFYSIDPVFIVKGGSLKILESEKYLLSLLSKFKYKPNIKFCGRSECFELSDEIIKSFNKHVKIFYEQCSEEQ